MAQARREATFAQRSEKKLHFDHKEMDYYLAWVMGRHIYDGSDPGECMEAASRINDGNPLSWQQVWPALAERLEARAEVAHRAGTHDDARKAWLRACTYHRAPLFMLHPDDPVFRPTVQRMQACFHKAAPLFDPPIERIQTPYQGRQLPGYFWKAAACTQRRPTVLVVGGIETFAEDCYFMTGPTGPQRGYNMLTVDLPGQGMNPDAGLTFGAKMGPAVQAAVDYALSRPEVDADRLAVFGFSWGGHIVFKGAQQDTRIKALIANPPMPDVFRAAWAQQGGQNKQDPIARLVFSQIAWRMGLKLSLKPRDIARRFGKAYDYLFHGKADLRKIYCPALLMAGEGEAPITLQIARECMARLPNPATKLVIFTREQGGEAHCQVDNLALPNGAMFDWLDEVLRRPHSE